MLCSLWTAPTTCYLFIAWDLGIWNNDCRYVLSACLINAMKVTCFFLFLFTLVIPTEPPRCDILCIIISINDYCQLYELDSMGHCITFRAVVIGAIGYHLQSVKSAAMYAHVSCRCSFWMKRNTLHIYKECTSFWRFYWNQCTLDVTAIEYLCYVPCFFLVGYFVYLFTGDNWYSCLFFLVCGAKL